MAADRTPFHIQCLKCQECKKKLTPATINEHEHRLYCPTCYEDLFNQKVRNNQQSNILIFIAWSSYLGWCSRKNSYASFTHWRNVHSCKFYLLLFVWLILILFDLGTKEEGRIFNSRWNKKKRRNGSCC